MAFGFLTCAAPDEHIAWLHRHPGAVHAYLDGVPPEGIATDALPAWWPSAPPATHTSWGVNHRNPDLYHWILNGSADLVTDAGALFQVWYAPDHAANILKLDGHNERFAVTSGQLPAPGPAPAVSSTGSGSGMTIAVAAARSRTSSSTAGTTGA